MDIITFCFTIKFCLQKVFDNHNNREVCQMIPLEHREKREVSQIIKWSHQGGRGGHTNWHNKWKQEGCSFFDSCCIYLMFCFYRYTFKYLEITSVGRGGQMITDDLMFYLL